MEMGKTSFSTPDICRW